jgi:hypothetical protein
MPIQHGTESRTQLPDQSENPKPRHIQGMKLHKSQNKNKK